MSDTIDFSSPIPFYIQLIEILKKGIDSGAWQPGERLPGEHELCDQFGVSRTVVRQALRELELQGLVHRHKGKGSFVAEPKISEGLVQKLTGFHHDMIERGLTPVTEVLKCEVVPANPKIAGFLEIEPGTPVVELERLRSVQGEPIVLVRSFVPHTICPGLEEYDFSRRSLYETLEDRYGVVIARGRRFIEAVLANQREAQLLNVREGSPLLMLDSVCYQADSVPVEYYHAVHRGDRTRFEVELVRVRGHGAAQGALAPFAAGLPPSNTLTEPQTGIQPGT